MSCYDVVMAPFFFKKKKNVSLKKKKNIFACPFYSSLNSFYSRKELSDETKNKE